MVEMAGKNVRMCYHYYILGSTVLCLIGFHLGFTYQISYNENLTVIF